MSQAAVCPGKPCGIKAALALVVFGADGARAQPDMTDWEGCKMTGRKLALLAVSTLVMGTAITAAVAAPLTLKCVQDSMGEGPHQTTLTIDVDRATVKMADEFSKLSGFGVQSTGDQVSWKARYPAEEDGKFCTETDDLNLATLKGDWTVFCDDVKIKITGALSCARP